MKKRYQPIEMEVIVFDAEDVITTSNGETCPFETEEDD